MFDPVSTYRIQLNKDLNFNGLEKIIPYLHSLGIRTIYTSPVMQSVPGSLHGYDGVDHNNIDPEIGSFDELKKISFQLKKLNMGWLQDIVPNHMAFHHHNQWLMDVLEKGKDSPYVGHFDLISSQKEDKVLNAPFLGDELETVINKGELELVLVENKFWFKYFEVFFPLKESSVRKILQIHRDPQKALTKTTANKILLKTLAEEQHYELAHWRQTEEHINYRRFFTVNGLICVNVHQRPVFEDVHAFVLSLVKEKYFDGLRVDHIDGIKDPASYLRQLRASCREETYLAVEKILEPGEQLSESWPVQGSTGYDFLSDVNQLFTASKNSVQFSKVYNEFTGFSRSYKNEVLAKKRLVLHSSMAGELESLVNLFRELQIVPEKKLNRVGKREFKKVLGEFLIHTPVYRYYEDRFPLSAEGKNQVKSIMAHLGSAYPALKSAVNLLRRALLVDPKKNRDARNQKLASFYLRANQFTGPLMAKGVEDTLMYTHNKFIAHNEVGDSPGVFGISVEEFHEKMIHRQAKWPLALNATSTHDTKRGEDSRARLNVLSEIPKEWKKAVFTWKKMNASFRKDNVPDRNEEYLIYQALIAAYPFSKENTFKERFRQYIVKSLREAKVHSNWSAPNEPYEKLCDDFAVGLLDKKRKFWKHFEETFQKVADHGIVNSLSQMLLKHTCPGVPDNYQGTEFWDLSFVDPDNRRGVDFKRRGLVLAGLKAADAEKIGELWKNRHDPAIKLFVLKTLLHLRNQNSQVFLKGQYVPLEIGGLYRKNIFAFARHHKQTWIISVVPLNLLSITKNPGDDVNWQDTHIILPAFAGGKYESALDANTGNARDQLYIANIFKILPLACIKITQVPNKRGAGILLPIAALPSPFAIGDVGPEARKFAEFLNRGGQKYWQILPLNPTDEGSGNSPYSSSSSMAGNTLLISPELLAIDDLLQQDEVRAAAVSSRSRIDYAAARRLKKRFLDTAYSNFIKADVHPLKGPFKNFCEDESSWLDDYALFIQIKTRYSGEPWFKWSEALRDRKPKALDAFQKKNREALDQIKWNQFIFHKQWREFKTYCNDLGIQLFGDLPFYVSHDSDVVWANREIFSLGEAGDVTGMAGVPPDYFTKTGQLWGMPTFKWDVLRKTNYEWWIKRFRKNLQLFDLLRIDHFRALAEYWEVPAGEKTAENGKWKTGPGAEFFKVIKEALGETRFIAEDLGEEMEKVYRLRDEVKLPGMKILQYAFGDNFPDAVDLPHNFTTNCIVYTGTHDNNTTKGWYRHELEKKQRIRLDEYLGQKSSPKNITDLLMRLAYASIADTAILPMQDVLGLDERSRTNTPGTTKNNWMWRLPITYEKEEIEKFLMEMVKTYKRY